jgi:hypothetical protein
MELAALDPGMTYHDDIPPSHMDVPSEHNDAVPYGVNRFAESFGASAVRDPILTQVASGPESPGFVKTRSIRWGNREIETIRRPRNNLSLKHAHCRWQKQNNG